VGRDLVQCSAAWRRIPCASGRHNGRDGLDSLDTGAPEGAFYDIRARLHGLALHAGEPGSADQIASGLDIALHDLAARRAGVPLATFLGGAPRALPTYTSEIVLQPETTMRNRPT
jgi:hypothetical protein